MAYNEQEEFYDGQENNYEKDIVDISAPSTPFIYCFDYNFNDEGWPAAQS